MNVTSQFPLYRPDTDPIGFRNRFDLILADPPWQYRDTNSNGARGAAHKYDVHAVREIAQLDVNAIAAPNSVLAMWATMPMFRRRSTSCSVGSALPLLPSTHLL